MRQLPNPDALTTLLVDQAAHRGAEPSSLDSSAPGHPLEKGKDARRNFPTGCSTSFPELFPSPTTFPIRSLKNFVPVDQEPPSGHVRSDEAGTAQVRSSAVQCGWQAPSPWGVFCLSEHDLCKVPPHSAHTSLK